MKFKYKDLIEKFGFQRMNSHDPVWERQYGFEYFVVWKDVPKDFTFEFDICTRELFLLNLDHYDTIKSKHKIESRQNLINLLNILDPENEYPIKKDAKTADARYYGYHAC